MFDEEGRYALFLKDRAIKPKTILPHSVECICGSTIKIDARRRYYPTLWLKHRESCPEILKKGIPDPFDGLYQAPGGKKKAKAAKGEPNDEPDVIVVD
jgi:hypothetical protein